MKTITIPLAELRQLRQHETRKLLPPPREERVQGLSTQLARGAQLPPGYLVLPDLLVAGETRRQAHVMQQRDMEFIALTEDEAWLAAIGENTNREQYRFKFQIAWNYCPLALRVVDKAIERRTVNLRHHSAKTAEGATAALSSQLPATLEDVADLIHVSRRLLLEVIGAYRAIVNWDVKNPPRAWGDDEQPRTALDYWSRRIRDEDAPCTPGQAVAGLAGARAGDEGRTLPTPKPFANFRQCLAALTRWGKSFGTFTGQERAQAGDAIKRTVCAWPPELRREFLAEIKRLEREDKEGMK